MEDKTMTADTPSNVSRRNFIKGVIASGAAVSSAAYLWRSSSVLGQQPSAPGSVERLITLTVNGQERRVDVLKQETLATTLRYKLGLTGTKLGCDRAECGACTVLVDDVPHYSCSILTHAVRGKQIVTIEDWLPPTARCTPCNRAWSTSRVPVRVLHVGLHHGRGGLPQDESKPDARATRARDLRQPLSLPGLRQDSHLADARC